MKTGWIKVGGDWFHMNGSGVMSTGWLASGGSWYWLGSHHRCDGDRYEDN